MNRKKRIYLINYKNQKMKSFCWKMKKNKFYLKLKHKRKKNGKNMKQKKINFLLIFRRKNRKFIRVGKMIVNN